MTKTIATITYGVLSSLAFGAATHGCVATPVTNGGGFLIVTGSCLGILFAVMGIIEMKKGDGK